MPDSIFPIQIGQAIEARLKLASVVVAGVTHLAPTPLSVERGRVGQVSIAEVIDSPLISITYIGQEEPMKEGRWGNMLVRHGRWAIDMFALANANVPSEETIDPLYQWVIKALQSDPQLGGIAHDIDELTSEMSHTAFSQSSDVLVGLQTVIRVNGHSTMADPTTRS